MFLVTCHLPVYVPVLLTIVTASLHIYSGQVKISDACHGLPDFSQTYNTLECDESTQICITEVRYYLWDPNDQVCPRLISAPVSDRCCRRKPERCSWIRNVTDHREKLQINCTDQNQCHLHSVYSEIIAAPCLQFTEISRFSSVRSITYTCTSSDKCPPFSTTATSPSTGSSGETVSTTGAVVGGLIGGLVTCALIVTLLVFLWKRRSGEKPQGLSRSDDVTEIQTVSRPRAAFHNINSRYSLYQPARDDSNTPWDRGAATNVSDLHSQVNKTRTEVGSLGDTAFSVGTAVIASNHHGSYDRVQGEAAHFTVHGDYDHVIRHSHGETSSDDITADVDMTYNHLHRGRAVPAKAETEADPYDVLIRANTRTT